MRNPDAGQPAASGELRLMCRPEQADELIARARAAFPTIGEPRGPYSNRPGMVRIDLDLDAAVAGAGGGATTTRSQP